MKKKIVRREPENTAAFSDIHPVLQRVYSGRGVQDRVELEHGLERLLPWQGLLGIHEAVSCLDEALIAQKNLLIVGDFDVDGATSTAVAVRVLRSFGAQHVNFLVPNRFAFGYGLTPELVQVAVNDFQPDLIVTVDNGIANHAGVLAAKEQGIQVVITDHHVTGETLPLADAIVNPNQPNDSFSSKNLAGVGVIFYVMLALRHHLNQRGWFQQQEIPVPNMSQWLDLVALGTVADVVRLDHNNRILVQQGLRRIGAGRCVPAILALLEIGNRNPARIVAADLGFVVAPRLNAAGRLDDMSLGIQSLLSDNLSEARGMASMLDQLNDERRLIEQDMQAQALNFLKKLQFDQKSLPTGICLFDEAWHQGVIGILASRIKDRLQRPVIAFAPGNENDLKGSARSVSGVHVRDVLAEIAAQRPGLISKFGGHAMAAGLTLSRSALKEFTLVFDQIVSSKMNEEDLAQSVMSDGELRPGELTLAVAEILRDAGPWGQAFPEPLFDGVFQVLEQRLLAGKHLKMMLARDDKILEAIVFNVDVEQWPNYRCEAVNIVYRMDVNEFQNRRKAQLVVEYLEAV
jgi:single-stranded-DNA-specific exonuclease